MLENFDNKSAIVIGGAGFVGSNLVKLLLKSQISKILVVDNLFSSEPENIPKDPRVEFLCGSIQDPEILKQISDEYNYIYHLATFHGNQSSIHNPVLDYRNNLITSVELMWHIRDFKKLEKLVYAGAGCAVAEKTFEKAEATVESDIVSLDMDSPYSISKLVGEFYAKYFNKNHNVPTVRARFQNVYGPGEVLGAGRWRGTYATVWRNVTPTFIWKALNQQALTVQNGGIATRDFIFVEDMAEGLARAALFGVPGDVYNLATGEETTILRLAELINEMTENKTPMDFQPKRSWDNSGKRFGSTEKAKEVLGFEAKTLFADGLKKTIDWTKQNESFIARNISKHSISMRDF